MTTGSSMQAMTLAIPPQTRHVSTSISPEASTFGENPLQPLRPGYCHGWHVCRFCRQLLDTSTDYQLFFPSFNTLLL
jgi:hypothetical protein